MNIRKKVFL